MSASKPHQLRARFYRGLDRIHLKHGHARPVTVGAKRKAWRLAMERLRRTGATP